MSNPPHLTSAFLPVRHGFFGRNGGISKGLYQSLNCGLGTDDARSNVQENRSRIMQALQADHLLLLNQYHSVDCVIVEDLWSPDSQPQADALVTDRPNLAIGILTADCAPVLFYGEKENGDPVIGAAHAGWGGALRGVLENTVQTMLDLGAGMQTLRAAIGPCILQKSYEVSADFADPFIAQDSDNDDFFKSALRGGHLMFDLPGYCARRLARVGLGRVWLSGVDTYSAEKDYFSYRRATHRQESDYGRQVSAIKL